MANSSRSKTYYCDAALLLALVYTVATIRSDLRYIFVQIPSRDNLLKKALFNICIMRLIIFFFSEKILRELNMMNYITRQSSLNQSLDDFMTRIISVETCSFRKFRYIIVKLRILATI